MKKGTNHFSRMNYHVKRGLTDLISDHSLTHEEWDRLLIDFKFSCAFCGEVASIENRGIVADHLIAASKHGEYVIGNIVPACQTCNDTRGNGDWKPFLKRISGDNYGDRLDKINGHIDKYEYVVNNPVTRLKAHQAKEYNLILAEWNDLWERSRRLRDDLKDDEK